MVQESQRREGSSVDLPEVTWSKDGVRCLYSRHPPHGRLLFLVAIALDLLKKSVIEGVSMRGLTADEGYGRCRQFRDRVADLGLL